MGSLSKWRKIAFIGLARYLAKGKEIDSIIDMTEQEIEQFVLQKKDQIDNNKFLYAAGYAGGAMMEKAYSTCNDDLNAAFGALYDYENIIGIGQ